MHGANHADDLAGGLFELGAVTLAEDQAFGQREVARKGFVDDGHASGGSVVAIGEDASAQDRDFEDIEIAG